MPRKYYKTKFKLEVVAYAEENCNCKAARLFEVSESLVRDWRNSKPLLEALKTMSAAKKALKRQSNDSSTSTDSSASSSKRCKHSYQTEFSRKKPKSDTKPKMNPSWRVEDILPDLSRFEDNSDSNEAEIECITIESSDGETGAFFEVDLDENREIEGSSLDKDENKNSVNLSDKVNHEVNVKFKEESSLNFTSNDLDEIFETDSDSSVMSIWDSDEIEKSELNLKSKSEDIQKTQTSVQVSLKSITLEDIQRDFSVKLCVPEDSGQIIAKTKEFLRKVIEEARETGRGLIVQAMKLKEINERKGVGLTSEEFRERFEPDMASIERIKDRAYHFRLIHENLIKQQMKLNEIISKGGSKSLKPSRVEELIFEVD